MAKFSDDYYRVYKTLHLVTHEAVPCVDHCVKVWHQNQTLAPCVTQSRTQCPNGRKPKSCQQCMAWATAIEAVYYPPSTVPQVNWSNINPSNLALSHIEVAKGFVLRLPKTKGTPIQYTAMSDFDSASLLMIMARFGEFHRADKASYDQIMKVSDIRNALSHVKLGDNMQLDHQKVKQYFKDIEDFVTCLEILHPTHFTSGHNIRLKLQEIQQEPVSRKMKGELQIEMQENLEALCQNVTEMDMKTSAELKHVWDEIAIIKEDTYGQAIKKDNFIRCWRSLDCVLNRSIPCLRSVLKQWQENKLKTIKPCQRPRPRPLKTHLQECSEEGKPVPGSSCDNCVAWGEVIEDAYYSQTSTATVPWDTLNPMCFAGSHFMIAKAFVSKSTKVAKCTKLEDLDLDCLLDIMLRFKPFLEQERSSYEIVKQVVDIKSMMTERHEIGNVHLTDKELKDIHGDIDSFISFLQMTHPQWFVLEDTASTRTAIKQIQQETITRKLWQDMNTQIKCCGEDYRFNTSELKEQIQHMEEKFDRMVTRMDTTRDESADGEKFIKSCATIYYTVKKSIQCLKKVLQRWHSMKRKAIGGCQRAQSASFRVCKTEGKPTSTSWCANCVAWGEAVQGAYYPKNSKGEIPWDIIDLTYLSESIDMVAKAFVSKSDRAKECIPLEDLDVSSILNIMMRFKDFLGGQKSTHQTLSKISDAISMLTEMQNAKIFLLRDQQIDAIFQITDGFVLCLETLHSEWFTAGDAADVRKAIMKIKTTTFSGWSKEGLPRVSEIMEAFSDTTSAIRYQSTYPAFSDTTRDEFAERENFIKSCAAVYYTVTKSTPCLRKVLQRWHSTKRKTIQGCQRAQSVSFRVCKTEGKPTSTSWCTNCVAWGKAVQGAYYPQKSKGDIPWDIIDPTCLSESIDMIAKAFVANSDRAKECTQLEDLDVSSILNIMMRFKDFLGGLKSTHQILSKISDDIFMLTEMKEAKIVYLNDQQLETIYQNIDNFVSCLETLHSEWFTVGEAADIKKALLKIKTLSFSKWSKEGLPRAGEIMGAFDSTKSGVRQHSAHHAENTGNKQYSTLNKCREELHRYYLDSLCKIPLFPGDHDSSVNLKDIYTKLSFEIKLPSPCKPVKMPLLSYAEMFTRKSVEGRSYTRFLISAPAGLGKTTLAAKIAYDWITEEEEALKDVDLLFVINMRSVDHSSNLEEIILTQLFPNDTPFTSEDISSLLQRYGQSTIVILDAIDESDRNLFVPQTRGSLVEFLTGKILLPCKLVTTTRPWRIKEITQKYSAFAQVEINGFNKKDIRKYITKFFREDTEMAESLIRHANQNKLIDEIAYIPLMSLLICVYWRELQQENIPHRVTHLYDAIINIMHDHYLKKRGLTGQFDDIQPLIYQMGKIALAGFWPPENRVVFSPNEMSISDNVESACQMGFLTKQESRPSIIRKTGRTETTLTFFHKTCGEKCAGEYLAHLAEEGQAEITTKLSQLKTANDALSVKLILQFACGSSKKAAKMILDWLMRLCAIDRSVGWYMALQHANEKLELNQTLKIQNFVDLCLRCNYEANCAAEFSSHLSLFPLLLNGLTILFIGISAFTSVALEYYLSNIPYQVKWSIILRPAANHSKQYLVDYGPLINIMDKARRDVNHIPVDVIKTICNEYLQKHPDMHYKQKMIVHSAPAELLCNIHMWQACEGLPTPEESDVGPIFDSTKTICLAELDLNSFSIPERNMEKLLELIEKNHLSSLLFLNVCLTSMTENQMLRLAKELKRMTHLMILKVRQNFPVKTSNQFQFLTILAESMLSLNSLEFLHIDYVPTSENDMMKFVRMFSCFASQLRELTMCQEVGVMSDRVTSTFANQVVLAKNLMKFHISFDMITPSTQNEFLSKLRFLPCLFEVQIFFMNYADEVMRTMAGVMKSLPNLRVLAFSAAHIGFIFKLTISTTTWNKFKSALREMKKMSDLRLMHIYFKDEDFTDLVAICREKHYERLMYSTVCVPKGFVVPNDGFLQLY